MIAGILRAVLRLARALWRLARGLVTRWGLPRVATVAVLVWVAMSVGWARIWESLERGFGAASKASGSTIKGIGSWIGTGIASFFQFLGSAFTTIAQRAEQMFIAVWRGLWEVLFWTLDIARGAVGGVVYFLGFCIGVLVLLAFYPTFREGFGPLILVPIVFAVGIALWFTGHRNAAIGTLVVGAVLFTVMAIMFYETVGQAALLLLILASAATFALAGWISGRRVWWARAILTCTYVWFVAAILLAFAWIVLDFTAPQIFAHMRSRVGNLFTHHMITSEREDTVEKVENAVDEVYNSKLHKLETDLKKMISDGADLSLIEAVRQEIRRFKEGADRTRKSESGTAKSFSTPPTPAAAPPVQQVVARTTTSSFNPTKCPDEYVTLMDTHLASNPTVPRNLALAVMQWESGCKPDVTSIRGAEGLMQLMPDTARDLGVTNSFDPDQNIGGGVQYLAEQLRDFSSTEMALAAYNWGPGPDREGKYRGKSCADTAVYAPDETRKFVSGVIALAHSFDSSPVYLTSVQSQSTVAMTIDNFRSESVSLFWVDFSGREIQYATLQPQGEWNQPTYPGHVWKVRNSRGDEVQTLIASKNPHQPYTIN